MVTIIYIYMHISIYICSIHTHIDDTVSRLPTSPMVWNPHIHTFNHIHTWYCNTTHYTRLDNTTLHYSTVHCRHTCYVLIQKDKHACIHTYISGTETSEQTCLVIISACCIGRSSHPCATHWTSASSFHLSHLSPRIGQGLASTSEFLPFLCRMFSLQSIQYPMMNDPRLCVASEIVADTFAPILDISSLIVLKCLRTFELWQMTSCDRFR